MKRFILAAGALLLTTNFTIVRLQSPPGTVEVFAVNGNGYTAGAAGSRAVVWKPDGTMLSVPTVSGNMQALGINDNGTAVGTYASGTQGFTWQLGSSTVTTLPPVLTAIRAEAINQNGDIAESYGDSTHWRAVLVPAGGTAIDLGDLGGGQAAATSIVRDAPVVGGASTTIPGKNVVHGFVWIDGALIDVGTLGGTVTHTLAVTATNWPDPYSVLAAGLSEIYPGGPRRAFFWKNGAIITQLPLLPGGDTSTAHGINRSVQIVGTCDNGSGSTSAVLWTGGTIVDLNTWLGSGSGWVLRTAKAINENGQIAGTGEYFGAPAAFLITP